MVVPVYNEQENIEALWQRLLAALEAIGPDYEVVFVDDGSRDATPDLLDALHREHRQAVVIRLSRNFGHQAAVSCRSRACEGTGRCRDRW